MAKVRALRVCYVGNGLRKEGDVFDYTGPANTNLEYLDGEPQAEAAAPVADASVDESGDKPGKKWKPKLKRAADDAGEASV